MLRVLWTDDVLPWAFDFEGELHPPPPAREEACANPRVPGVYLPKEEYSTDGNFLDPKQKWSSGRGVRRGTVA